jgi:hypothetical protein
MSEPVRASGLPGWWQRLAERPGRELLLVAIVAVLNIVAVALDLPALIRVPLALPLVLFLPGYSLVRAALPTGTFEAVEMLLVSVGASIAIGAIGGILLALTPNGLSAMSWTLLLSVISIGGALVGSRRAPAAEVAEHRPWPRPTRGTAAILISAALAVGAILVGTNVIASSMVPPPPAQLWMLPVDGQPTQAVVGMRAGTPGGDYLIRLTSAGQQIEEFPLTLAAGQEWQTTVTFDPATRSRPIVARLYQPPSETDIRFVILAPPSPSGS